MKDEAVAALAHLEDAENKLSQIDGYTEHQERVWETRLQLANELMDQAYAESIKKASNGDVVIVDEADGRIAKLTKSEANYRGKNE